MQFSLLVEMTNCTLLYACLLIAKTNTKQIRNIISEVPNWKIPYRSPPPPLSFLPFPRKKGLLHEGEGNWGASKSALPSPFNPPPYLHYSRFPLHDRGGGKKYPPFSSSPLFRNLYSPQKVTFAAGGGKRGKLYVKGQDSTDRFFLFSLAVFHSFFAFSGFVREKVFLGGGTFFGFRIDIRGIF